METEKNSPETKSVIPDDVRAAIFGPAVGKLFVRTGTGRTLALTGLLVTTGGRSYWGRTMSPDGVEVYHDVSKLSIEVKSLGEISDEVISEMSSCFFDNYYRNAADLQWLKTCIVAGFTKNVSSGILPASILEIADWLRSRGYALPWGPYSVEQLVEAGIFKIIK